MPKNKRILFAIMGWGLGHATRCIPIIKALMVHQFEVVIAADSRPLHLLTTEFPNLEMTSGLILTTKILSRLIKH